MLIILRGRQGREMREMRRAFFSGGSIPDDGFSASALVNTVFFNGFVYAAAETEMKTAFAETANNAKINLLSMKTSEKINIVYYQSLLRYVILLLYQIVE